MKNIFEIMKEYGFEVPEDKKKDFEKAVLENYKTMTDYDNQTKKLDAANETIKVNDTAMKDLQDKLDGFKNVDVSGLNQRIKDLETEKSNIQKDYDAKIADRDFNDLVKESISAVNGKNAKAITALLDVDTLKASKNQKSKLLDHFKKYGMHEGRQACAGFNVLVYKARYADLQKAFGSDLVRYYEHYIQCGHAEGRKAV